MMEKRSYVGKFRWIVEWMCSKSLIYNYNLPSISTFTVFTRPSTFPKPRSRQSLIPIIILSMSSHYLFPSSSTPTPPRHHANSPSPSPSPSPNMPTPPPVPTSRSFRSFENNPPPPLPSSVSSPSPTPARSRKSFPAILSQGQQQRGGSYVTPPMANGRRMTSNPVRLH